jgi:hypothetical protein
MPQELLVQQLIRGAMQAHGPLLEVIFLKKNKDTLLVFADGTVLPTSHDGPQTRRFRAIAYEVNKYAYIDSIATQLRGQDPLSLLAFGYSGTGPTNYSAMLVAAAFQHSAVEDIDPPMRLFVDGSKVQGTMHDGHVEWEDGSLTNLADLTTEPTRGAEIARTSSNPGAPTTLGSLQQLMSPDFDVRIKAMAELREIKDASAVPQLIALLREDRDSRIREEAAYSLESIGDTRAVESLIAALMDRDGNVRLKAARALGVLKDLRAVELLCTSLRDPDQDVRFFAAYALEKLGDERAIEPLQAALKHTSREEASRAIQKALTTLRNAAEITSSSVVQVARPDGAERASAESYRTAPDRDVEIAPKTEQQSSRPSSDIILATCPHCSRVYRLTANRVGRNAKCACGQVFQVLSEPAQGSTVSTPDFGLAVPPRISGPAPLEDAGTSEGSLSRSVGTHAADSEFDRLVLRFGVVGIILGVLTFFGAVYLWALGGSLRLPDNDRFFYAAITFIAACLLVGASIFTILRHIWGIYLLLVMAYLTILNAGLNMLIGNKGGAIPALLALHLVTVGHRAARLSKNISSRPKHTPPGIPDARVESRPIVSPPLPVVSPPMDAKKPEGVISAACSECGQEFEFPAGYNGRSVACKCGATFVVDGIVVKRTAAGKTEVSAGVASLVLVVLGNLLMPAPIGGVVFAGVVCFLAGLVTGVISITRNSGRAVGIVALVVALLLRLFVMNMNAGHR